MNQKIVVVGAGPAGASAAACAAKNNKSVLLIEEHKEIGEPVQCAGIVSNRAIAESQVTSATLNKVKGAFIYSPNSKELKIEANSSKAHVIDRNIFDRKLVDSATKYGVNLSLDTKACGWNGKTLKIKKAGVKEKLNPEVVIGADGVASKIRREITERTPNYFLVGAQVVLKDVEVKDTDFVELFLGNKIAPGFFAWFIPIDNDCGRLGLCVRRGKNNPLFYLKKLLKDHPLISERFDGEELEWNFGVIPIGFLDKTFFEKTLLVGDAAAQAKPTSGGGVFTGVLCGKIAGKVSAKFLDDSFSLKNYEIEWKKEIGKELKRDLALHKTWSKLSDKKINNLIIDLDNKKIREIINQYGDIDYPSKLFFKLLKRKPILLKFGLSFLKNYIR